MYGIYHNFLVKGESKRVFDAFSTPEGLNSWWTLKSAGNPVLGNMYTFYFGPEFDWRAQVTHIVPGSALTWKMSVSREDWLPTSIGFQLVPLGENTSVSFFHKNWQEITEHFGITTYCWGQLLAGLKDYVETGAIIPFEKRN